MKTNGSKKVKPKKKKCGCIFCISKCPKCGSPSVQVEFDVRWEYVNDSEHSIELKPDENLRLQCNDCDSSYNYGIWGDDEVLAPLLNQLWSYTEMEGGEIVIERTHEGKVEVRRIITTTSEVNQPKIEPKELDSISCPGDELETNE